MTKKNKNEYKPNIASYLIYCSIMRRMKRNPKINIYIYIGLLLYTLRGMYTHTVNRGLGW
jgi:hypothetical protein